jgi:hypothetical protein
MSIGVLKSTALLLRIAPSWRQRLIPMNDLVFLLPAFPFFEQLPAPPFNRRSDIHQACCDANLTFFSLNCPILHAAPVTKAHEEQPFET